MTQAQWAPEDRQHYIEDGLDESIYRFDGIEQDAFDTLLSEYESLLPPKLLDLDKQRLEIIPATLKARGEDVFLRKDELTMLMDWKLSHGKFRPMLKGLIQQNPDDVVQETTRQAFAIYRAEDRATHKASVEAMTALRGVGPATASLLLATYAPTVVPFFSDELFRWAFFEPGKEKGWDRKIKYTLKEYRDLMDRVAGFRARIGAHVGCLDVEKVAYVLGKTAQGVVGGERGETVAKKRKGSFAGAGAASLAKEQTPGTKRSKTSLGKEVTSATASIESTRLTRSRK